MTQRKYNHDAGVIFGEAENVRSADAAPETRKEEVITMNYTERSHDAGVTFGETERVTKSNAGDGSMWGIAESIVKLGTASAKFAVDQVQSGFCLLTDPRKAFRRVQHSMDNFSRAMNESVEDAPSKS